MCTVPEQARKPDQPSASMSAYRDKQLSKPEDDVG